MRPLSSVVLSALLTILSAMLGACDLEPKSKAQVSSPVDPVTQRAAGLVEDYIIKSKHWDKDSFEVTFRRSENSHLVFSVLHVDDDAQLAVGGGKSVEVYFDPVGERVIKELGFQ
jgi:hypothetical protein